MRRTVLLVEDEAILAMAGGQAIERFGYEVVLAGSGEKAVRIAEENPEIGLVLMDMNLGGGMDGAEAARRILSRREVPIVFLTSYSLKRIEGRLEGITGYGYMMKDYRVFSRHSYIDSSFALRTRIRNGGAGGRPEADAGPLSSLRNG